MPASAKRQVEDSDVNWKKIAVIGAVTFIISLIIGRWFGNELLESRAGIKTPPALSSYPASPEERQTTQSGATPPRQNIASPPLVVPPPVVEPNNAPSPSTQTENSPLSSSSNLSNNNEASETTAAAPPSAVFKPETQSQPNTKAAAPYKGTNGFRVQAGLFANEANAKDLVSHLRDEGYKCDFEMIGRPDGNFYRVWVGPFDTHDEAETTAGELNGAGYQSFVLSTK